MGQLRKIFGYKEPDYAKWWGRQRDKYRSSWAEHPDKELAIQEAEDECDYRSSELGGISGRTVLFVTLAIAVFATAVSQGGHGTLAISFKLSAAAAAGAVIASLFAYAPPLSALFGRLMPPEVWIGLIKSSFDRYVKYMVRMERKTRPLDRYKRLHVVAAWSLITSIVLLAAAFLFR